MEMNNQRAVIFKPFSEEVMEYLPGTHELNRGKYDLPTLYLEAIASCHAITYVNSELIGDPLDVKMF